MRRREYLTLFGGSRRRDVFGDGRHGRGWMLPLLVVVLGAVIWVFATLGRNDAPVATMGDGAPIPSVLTPISTTTTAVAITESVTCPDTITDWATFHGSPDRAGCISAPKITDPEIRWVADIGVQGWLNSPVISGSTVYVGSAGSAQFESDGLDGVYALDVLTGDLRWFFPATLDVNGVSYDDGIVVAVGDEGTVWGIEAATGRQVWSDSLGSPVFGSPLFIDGVVVVGDGSGTLTGFAAASGERLWFVNLQGAIRGGATTDGELIYAIGERRDAVAVDADGTIAWRHSITPAAVNLDEFRVYAAPTLAEGLVIVSLVRDDIYPEPALVALAPDTGDIVWEAIDTAGLKSEWGNIRTSPAVVGDLLVYAEPYSDGIVAVEAATGRTRWRVTAGVFCYPQWSSPAVNDGHVIVGRHDGGLYAVDATTGTLAWSIYLGTREAEGAFPEAFGDEAFCEWQPAEGFSVLASPAVDDTGVVVVGTLEGHLIAVGDTSW